jgi:hypothetical protein
MPSSDLQVPESKIAHDRVRFRRMGSSHPARIPSFSTGCLQQVESLVRMRELASATDRKNACLATEAAHRSIVMWSSRPDGGYCKLSPLVNIWLMDLLEWIRRMASAKRGATVST